MISSKDFLKKYTNIPNSFIDDLYKMYNESTLPTDIVIDVDYVAKWLHVPKFRILETLRHSYEKNVDYSVEKTQDPNKKVARANNYKKVLLTPECFKLLAMRSATKKADEIRSYFIEIETTLLKYRQDLVDGLERRVAELERNQQPQYTLRDSKRGMIYIIKAHEDRDDIVKLGRTKNWRKRLSNHASSRADDPHVLYQYECDDVEEVEACVKGLIKKYKYRKYKEVYQADVDMIKYFVQGCANLKMKYKSRKSKREINGGYYIAVFREEDAE
jgi:phage anti-repressor protein